MGMHLGLIAVKTSAENLKSLLLSHCPHLELVDSKSDFASIEEVWQWKDDKTEFVSAADWSLENPGKSVYLIWQDGDWALFFDSEYVLSSNNDLLSGLSKQLDQSLSFVVESAGGCAFFTCFENGTLRRKITYFDDNAELEGEPLPEEEGIDVDNYYMDETEALWKAFGINAVQCLQTSKDCLAIRVIDRTDYSQ